MTLKKLAARRPKNPEEVCFPALRVLHVPHMSKLYKIDFKTSFPALGMLPQICKTIEVVGRQML
jgi:hypothetical protein